MWKGEERLVALLVGPDRLEIEKDRVGLYGFRKS